MDSNRIKRTVKSPVAGRSDSSVGTVFRISSGLRDTSANQVQFLLASLAKIWISETIIKIVPAVVCINGLTVTFRVAVVSQGIFWRNAEDCTGFPPPLDSRHLRSRIA